VISTADYQAVLDRLGELVEEMAKKLDRIPAAEWQGIRIVAASGLPDFLVSSIEGKIKSAAREVSRLGREAQKEVDQLLKEANLPFKMAEYDDHWQAVKELATKVASSADYPDERIGVHWSGEAAKAYYGAVGRQVKAATAAGNLAQVASVQLSDMASAGMTYYTAVCIAMALYVAAVAAAIASIATGPGVAIGLAAFAVASVTYAGAMATATFLLRGSQNRAATALRGAAHDNTGFAAGPTWPTAVRELYDNDPDDPEDWKLKRRRGTQPQPI
jgi:hypothetical protein